KAAPDLLFRSEHTDRHPTEVADLHGRRFVVCNETSKGRAWDEATVKDCTGGDRLKARRMREDFWEFDPTHKLVVWGNHKPTIANVDDGMRRRLRLVPFSVSFVGRENRNLLAELLEEAPGILTWLVHGCLAWQRDGLPAPRAVLEATAAYMHDEDTIGQFFERVCRFEVHAKMTRKALRDRYLAWSAERDEKPASGKAFAEAVRRRGVIERSVRTDDGPREGWHGVRLATDAERTEAEMRRSAVAGSSGPNPVDRDTRARETLNRESGATGHYGTTGDDFGDAAWGAE
ncbi:MAG TPA: phage/plasmid primase, P4 family, partial [Polyangiaceae bacterium]